MSSEEKSVMVRVRKELEALVEGFAKRYRLRPHVVRNLAIHFGLADLYRLLEKGVKPEDLEALYRDLTTPRVSEKLGLSEKLAKIYEILGEEEPSRMISEVSG